MTKSFKLTHRPGQPSMQNTSALHSSSVPEAEETESTRHLEPEIRVDLSRNSNSVADRRASGTTARAARFHSESALTTRKTIEVPEDYFFRVKMHALQRRMKEKDIWAEILEEYFS